MPERIAIVGCGALGSVLAGLLASAGQHVLAVCRWRKHLESINAHGLLLVEDGKEMRLPLRVCPQLPAGETCDLVIVLVKSFDTEAVAVSLADRLSPGTPVLTLQNGLGNAEALAARLKPEQVLAGTTTFAAQREGPGVVRLTGRGECEIGAWHPSGEQHLRPTADLLSRCGLPCSVSSRVATVLWRKLAVNAVINPLTAILRVRNGELLERGEIADLFAEVVEEVCRVAAQLQIVLPPPAELVAEVRRVCQTTAANRSSMLRDVEQGRRTEVDAINGAVVRLARDCGIPVPANQTLASLVRAMTSPRSRHSWNY